MPRFFCISCCDEAERVGWPVPEPCPACGSALSCCLDGEPPSTVNKLDVGDMTPPRGHDPQTTTSSQGYQAAPQAQELLYYIPPAEEPHFSAELLPAEGHRTSDDGNQSGIAPPAPRTSPTPARVTSGVDGRVVEYTPATAEDKPRSAIVKQVHPDGTADLKVIWKYGQFLNLNAIPFAKTSTPGTWSHLPGAR